MTNREQIRKFIADTLEKINHKDMDLTEIENKLMSLWLGKKDAIWKAELKKAMLDVWKIKRWIKVS